MPTDKRRGHPANAPCQRQEIPRLNEDTEFFRLRWSGGFPAFGGAGGFRSSVGFGVSPSFVSSPWIGEQATACISDRLWIGEQATDGVSDRRLDIRAVDGRPLR